MSDITLIYPYQYKHARNAMLFHPLGIAQLSALLRQQRMNTEVVDLTFREVDEVLAKLSETCPRVVGIYVMLTMTAMAHKLAKKIRKLVPGVILVCGGPMPTLRPEQFAGDFDFVFRGEAVHSLPDFCRDYMESGKLADVMNHYERYPGIYFKGFANGAIRQTPVQQIDEKTLNHLPIPDRSDFSHDLYQQFWQKRDGFSPAGLMTTYGCPCNCDFCSKPVFGNNFRCRDMDSIMEEIHDIKSLGYNGIWLADDCFTINIEHVRAFCRRLLLEKLNMQWICLSRTDMISSEDVDLMRRAGCRKVFFGLESGSNSVLKLMNKHTTVEAAERTLGLFSRSGIATAGFFMVGYPGETYATIDTTFAWALSLPLNEISFTIPVPLPGTGLFNKVYDLQADADWNYENENRLLYQSEFDEKYLQERIEETYARFAAK